MRVKTSQIQTSTAPSWAAFLRTSLAPSWARQLAGFCPTGKGGGQDNSCAGKGGGAGGGASPAADKAVSTIARERLKINSLEMTGNDALDFHQVPPEAMRNSLLDAYVKGATDSGKPADWAAGRSARSTADDILKSIGASPFKSQGKEVIYLPVRKIKDGLDKAYASGSKAGKAAESRPEWATALLASVAPAWARTLSGFCPTGAGGGQDNSCGTGGGKGGSGGGTATAGGRTTFGGIKLHPDMPNKPGNMHDEKGGTVPDIGKAEDAPEFDFRNSEPKDYDAAVKAYSQKHWGKPSLEGERVRVHDGAKNRAGVVKSEHADSGQNRLYLDIKFGGTDHTLRVPASPKIISLARASESAEFVHEDACPCSKGDGTDGVCACSTEYKAKAKVAAEVASPQAMTGKLWEVVVVETGMSKNARLYPAEVLQKAVPLFEDLNVYAHKFDQELWNHLPEDVRQAYPDGIAGSLCGFLENARYDPEYQSEHQKRQNLRGAIVADLRMVDDKMRGIFKNLHDAGRLDKLGFSIDVEGQVSEGESIQDIPTKRVESIDSAYALDVVTYPAAGGRMRRLKASTPQTGRR